MRVCGRYATPCVTLAAFGILHTKCGAHYFAIANTITPHTGSHTYVCVRGCVCVCVCWTTRDSVGELACAHITHIIFVYCFIVRARAHIRSSCVHLHASGRTRICVVRSALRDRNVPKCMRAQAREPSQRFTCPIYIFEYLRWLWLIFGEMPLFVLLLLIHHNMLCR